MLAGDFNVIPEARDAARPELWTGDALFLPETRAKCRELLALGFTDALRATTDAGGLYTFWDYQAGAWQKNNGIRIDHLLLSPQAADRLDSGRDRQGDARPRQGLGPYADPDRTHRLKTAQGTRNARQAFAVAIQGGKPMSDSTKSDDPTLSDRKKPSADAELSKALDRLKSEFARPQGPHRGGETPAGHAARFPPRRPGMGAEGEGRALRPARRRGRLSAPSPRFLPGESVHQVAMGSVSGGRGRIRWRRRSPGRPTSRSWSSRRSGLRRETFGGQKNRGTRGRRRTARRRPT